MSSNSVEIMRLVKEKGACQIQWEMARKLDSKFMKQSVRDDFFIPKSKISSIFEEKFA